MKEIIDRFERYNRELCPTEIIFLLWRKYFPEDYWWEPFDMDNALAKLRGL